ncbi:MAG: hypothetical protein AB9869_17760 [Verrucomicrobiia bacterium]
MSKRTLRQLIEAAIKASRMEGATFGDATELVKSRTRTYLDTWVIGPLQEALERIDEQVEAGKSKAAQALARAGAGIKRTLTDEERARRAESLAKARAKRWPKHKGKGGKK